MKRNKNLIAAAVCAAAVLAVILLVVPRLTRGSTGRDQALIEQGIAYLRDLESRDISVVQNAVKEVRMAKARAQGSQSLKMTSSTCGLALTTP